MHAFVGNGCVSGDFLGSRRVCCCGRRLLYTGRRRAFSAAGAGGLAAAPRATLSSPEAPASSRAGEAAAEHASASDGGASGSSSSSSSSSASASRGSTHAAAIEAKFERMREKFGSRAAAPPPDATYAEFEEALADFKYSFAVNDIAVGRVHQIEPNGALVDVGAKASAFMPLAEASMNKVERSADVLELGESREFQVIAPEDEHAQLRLSLRRLEFARAWQRVHQMQEEDASVTANVLSANRGGLIVRVENLRAFLPGSHLSLKRDVQPQDLVGTKMLLKFLEVDSSKNRLVVSQRRAVVDKSMVKMEPGEVVAGVVRGTKPYGAFIDVNGVSGLLHISQISHDHVDDVGQVLPVGESIKCMIISQDREKGRLSLSTKVLEPEPGDMLNARQSVFERAEATAAQYHERMASEEKARAKYAEEIVAGLDVASLGDVGGGGGGGGDDDVSQVDSAHGGAAPAIDDGGNEQGGASGADEEQGPGQQEESEEARQEQPQQ